MVEVWLNVMLGTIDLSLHADDVGRFYCGSWPLRLQEKSLYVSLAIVVPSKKLFIPNLQIRSQEGRASVYGAFSGVRVGVPR